MSDLIPVEYRAERVLTTEQLAQAYECEPIQIQQNYNNNKDHFEEGKHFYKLTGEDLKEFKASVTGSKFSSQFLPIAGVTSASGRMSAVRLREMESKAGGSIVAGHGVKHGGRVM